MLGNDTFLLSPKSATHVQRPVGGAAVTAASTGCVRLPTVERTDANLGYRPASGGIALVPSRDDGTWIHAYRDEASAGATSRTYFLFRAP